MKNGISPWPLGLMLFWITSACSLNSLRADSFDSPPSLDNRTLRLSPDLPGFEYQWEECVKHFLWICTKQEMKKEFYDLRDAVVRKQLIDMGFILKVREKP